MICCTVVLLLYPTVRLELNSTVFHILMLYDSINVGTKRAECETVLLVGLGLTASIRTGWGIHLWRIHWRGNKYKLDGVRLVERADLYGHHGGGGVCHPPLYMTMPFETTF